LCRLKLSRRYAFGRCAWFHMKLSVNAARRPFGHGASLRVCLFVVCCLLFVVVGLYQNCTQGQMYRYLSTFSQLPRFDIVSHKSNLSLSPFGMLLNKAIQNVDYSFSSRPRSLPSLATMSADSRQRDRQTRNVKS
jgi:hypothetical protein